MGKFFFEITYKILFLSMNIFTINYINSNQYALILERIRLRKNKLGIFSLL